jgi:hypothetical protein
LSSNYVLPPLSSNPISPLINASFKSKVMNKAKTRAGWINFTMKKGW